MHRIYLFFVLFSSLCQAQQRALILGNHDPVCLPENLPVLHSATLPLQLDSVDVILLFSGAQSNLSDSDVDRIIHFVENGGGLYTGSENWPLQAESNQLTERIYRKRCFGVYTTHEAEINQHEGNLSLDGYIPAGTSTVAFPLDPRLRVEVWIDDQPLILSGFLQEGRIVIDGGYSRFYCNQRSAESDAIFEHILQFLKDK